MNNAEQWSQRTDFPLSPYHVIPMNNAEHWLQWKDFLHASNTNEWRQTVVSEDGFSIRTWYPRVIPVCDSDLSGRIFFPHSLPMIKFSYSNVFNSTVQSTWLYHFLVRTEQGRQKWKWQITYPAKVLIHWLESLTDLRCRLRNHNREKTDNAGNGRGGGGVLSFSFFFLHVKIEMFEILFLKNRWPDL